MTKKYELTDITTTFFGRTLYRIKALKDFGVVKAGDLGGWVEKEENLSQEGTCWVYDEAKIYDNAKVFGNALVYGAAMVCKNAQVYDNAKGYGIALIYGNARVLGAAKVFDNARVLGDAKVYDTAKVFNYAKVLDSTRVYGDAEISGNTRVSGNATIFTALTKTTDYLCLGPIGSRDDCVTFTKSNNVIYVATGCFSGTLEEFKQAVSQTHKTNRYARQYQNAIDMAEKHFNI